MSDIDRLMRDKVSLLKKTGEQIENIKASVQRKKIFINRSDIMIESGDLIQRKMSNGGEETFEVIDPGFHEKFHAISAHYQMDVRKLGIPEAERAIQNITYNITGNNVRIYKNSTDNSVNIVYENPELFTKIEELREEIKTLNLTKEREVEALEIVDGIKNNIESGRPNKTIIDTLLVALPKAANIASIGSFILSCLK